VQGKKEKKPFFFILRFNEDFLTLQIPLKEGLGGERRTQRQGEDRG
jgi:hypothetical protein